MASGGEIRAVFDPGVLISGLISDTGAPREILDSWRAGGFELVVSEALLRELAGVLARPKFRRYFDLERAVGFMEELRAGASIESEESIARVSPDPKEITS